MWSFSYVFVFIFSFVFLVMEGFGGGNVGKLRNGLQCVEWKRLTGWAG